jgi:glycerol-3-phosphate acyltransferase PlsX
MMLLKNIKQIFLKNPLTKLSYLGVKSGVSELKTKLDYNAVGGAPLIGVKKPVLKAHGSSKAETFKNAIRQAMQYAESGAIEAITEGMEQKGEEGSHE